MDKQAREEFLKSVYQRQIIEKGRPGITAKNENFHLYREIVNYWEGKGVLNITTQASGFVNFELTTYGIDFVESELLRI